MGQKLNRIVFTLREGEDYIPLIALLKATGVVYSGSEAQEVVTAGMVLRNGEVELRKRAKITPGEVIAFQNYMIEVRGWISGGGGSMDHLGVISEDSGVGFIRNEGRPVRAVYDPRKD